MEVGKHDGRPDLAVASSVRVADAIASGATEVILEGRAGMKSLSRAGFRTRAHLPLPSVDAPDLILPLGPDSPAHYALARWRPGETPAKRARNTAAARLARWGIVPGRPRQFVGARDSGTPMLIGAASGYGIPADVGWFMTLAHGDDLTRGVFHLFPPAAREPAWVLKFARVPDYDEPFVRDEAGLGLAASAGPSVSAHAPRLQGRLQVAGHHASIETAAVGERLSTMLARGGPGARAAIDEIAAWILEVGRATAAPAEALAEERVRLERDVIPRWQADPRLVTALPAVAAVLQHNDLGSWNIVWASPGRFMAVDWEAARRHGFPLWDLLYFLVDALPLVDGHEPAWAGPDDVPGTKIVVLEDGCNRWKGSDQAGVGLPPGNHIPLEPHTFLGQRFGGSCRRPADLQDPGGDLIDRGARAGPTACEHCGEPFSDGRGLDGSVVTRHL